MWAFLFAYCQDAFAVPWRPAPIARPFAGFVGWFVLSVALLGLGFGSAPVATVAISFAAFVLYSVGFTYRCVERAAHLPLEHPLQPPVPPRYVPLVVPTATSLYELALAIDAIRREQPHAAKELLRTIRADVLRGSHTRLLEGVRALVTLHLGDPARAAQRALAALPTGCEELDTRLGRLALASAWTNDLRLRAIDQAWDEAGVGLEGAGVLSTLRRLLELRLSSDDTAHVKVAPDERQLLIEEARAVGDEQLAREIEASLNVTHGYR